MIGLRLSSFSPPDDRPGHLDLEHGLLPLVGRARRVVLLAVLQRGQVLVDRVRVLRHLQRRHERVVHVHHGQVVHDLRGVRDVLEGGRPPLARVEVYRREPDAVRARVAVLPVEDEVVLRVARGHLDRPLALPQRLLDEAARYLADVRLLVDLGPGLFQEPPPFLAHDLDAHRLQEAERLQVDRVRILRVHHLEPSHAEPAGLEVGFHGFSPPCPGAAWPSLPRCSRRMRSAPLSPSPTPRTRPPLRPAGAR